jgi:clan AA aspartic protease (TIGR02281 family)
MRCLFALALAAVCLCLAAPIAQAAVTVEQSWPAGRFTVAQMRLDDGGRICVVGDFSVERNARYLVGRDASGNTTFLVSFGNQHWTSGDTVRAMIDGGGWRMNQPKVSSDGSWLYQDNLTDDFRHALYNGQSMTVSVNDLYAEFSLSGSATALTMLYRCTDALGQQQAYMPPTRSAPSPVMTAESAPGKVEVPITRHDGAIWVRVSLNGSASVLMMLDSGATLVSIPRWLAERLMSEGSMTRDDYVGRAVATLADGSKTRDLVYRLRSLTVAGRTVMDVKCTVSEGDEMLLLGQSFLDKFGSWSIDNGRNALVLND